MCNITLNNIEDKSTILIIKIPDTKTHIERTFIVVGENNLKLFKKYLNLRPENIPHQRLFIFYKNGKCTKQPVGLHTFGKIPNKIAEFLKLANPELYTGHCLRRSSATLLVDGGASITNLKRHGGWKSANIAEGYVENSIQNKIDIANKIQHGKTCVDEKGETSTKTVNITQKNINHTVEIQNDILSEQMSSPCIKIYNPSNCTFNFAK